MSPYNIPLQAVSYTHLDVYKRQPVWKADTPNMHGFIDKMPDQKGKHCFAFNTHGALPYLYFPIVLPNLKNHGLLPIGYRDWYGNVTMPGMPKPYYTYGHPDAQDVMAVSYTHLDVYKRQIDDLYSQHSARDARHSSVVRVHSLLEQNV